MLDARDEALGPSFGLVRKPKTDVHVPTGLVTLVWRQASSGLGRQVTNGDVVKPSNGGADLRNGLSQIDDRLVRSPREVRAPPIVAGPGTELLSVHQTPGVGASNGLTSLLRTLVVDHEDLADLEALLVLDPGVESPDLLPGHPELFRDGDQRIARLDLVVLLRPRPNRDGGDHLELLTCAYEVSSNPVPLRDLLHRRPVALRDLS